MISRVAQGRRAHVAALVALLLTLVCTPCLARAAQRTATITVKVRVFQEYKVPVSGLQNTFEYVIEPVEADAPMPVDANGKTYNRFSFTREESGWLEFPVEVTVDPSARPYMYHYMLRPVQKELSDGLYYVDVLSTSLSAGVNEYPLEIHVQPSNVDAAVSIVTPTVHIDGWDSPKVADPGWRIAYKAPADDTNKTNATDATRAAGTTSAASGGPLARTGDVLAFEVMICAACGGLLLLAHSALLRRRAGDNHA